MTVGDFDPGYSALHPFAMETMARDELGSVGMLQTHDHPAGSECTGV